jgi:membrane protein
MPAEMSAKAIWPLTKRTFNEWLEDKVPKMSAALAYYITVSLAPLLVITLKIVGVAFGPKAASTQVHDQIASLTGPQVAEALQATIAYAGKPGSGTFATILSIIIALFGASGVFGELQDSLNTIWEVRAKSDRGIWGIIQDRFLSMTMVLGCAFLLLVSMFVSTALTSVSSGFLHMMFGADGMTSRIIGFTLDLCLSTAVVTALFAAIFKVLPDVKIAWKDVWLGAFVTAVLFQIGKYALGVYFAKAAPGSAYGAAGSIVALLLWTCYSAYILFFGAEFTQVYANEYGTRIVPSKNAEPLTEDMRKQAGIPHGEPKTQTRGGLTSSRPVGQPSATGVAPPAPPRPRRIAPRRRRRQPTPRVTGDHRSYVVRYLPMLAGVVLGRFAWKHYHEAQPTAQSLKNQWTDAGLKWKKLASLFVSDSPKRYTMTHGPTGRKGASWSDLVGETSK